MAKVTLTELIEGDVALAADANATLTSWQTASTDIDANNVREEGLDRRSIAKTMQEFGLTNQSDQTAGLHSTIPLQVISQFNPMQHIGPFNYDSANGDQLVIRASFHFAITRAAISAGGGDTILTACLGYKHLAGGAATFIAQTIRYFDAIPNYGMKAPVGITHLYAGAQDTDLWLTMMVGLSSSNAALTAEIRDPQIMAVLYKR